VRAAALKQVKEVLNFLPYAPKVSLSVLSGHNLKRIFPLIDEVYQQLGRRVGTGELNQLFALITQRVRPPLFRYRPIKFYYLTQPETHPPTFIAFVNHPEGVPDSYRRYLVKELRQGLNLNLAPIRLFLKKRSRRGSA
jgi:GTP-binding protein